MSNSKASRQRDESPISYSRGFSGPLYVAVADSLQNQILAGTFSPGSSLPPIDELAQKYRVANMTVRQAVGLLAKKGFVTRRHGKGTFVQEGAGKLLIGILVGPSLAEEATHFYRAVVKVMREAIEASGWISRTYDGLNDAYGVRVPMDSSVVKQLRMDLNSQIFHGFVEISPGFQGLDDLEEGFPLPKVRYEPPSTDTDLAFDLYDFGRKSVQFLVSKGISDISYIRPYFTGNIDKSTEENYDLDGIFDIAKELNLKTPDIDGIEPLPVAPGMRRETDEFLYKHAIDFFRKRKRKKSKFGLIVSDDIGMRTIAMAMKQEQIDVPEHCEIICLANEQIDLHYGYSVNRYELPLMKLALKSLELLKLKISGGVLPKLPILIPGKVVSAEEKEAKSKNIQGAEQASENV